MQKAHDQKMQRKNNLLLRDLNFIRQTIPILLDFLNILAIFSLLPNFHTFPIFSFPLLLPLTPSGLSTLPEQTIPIPLKGENNI